MWFPGFCLMGIPVWNHYGHGMMSPDVTSWISACLSIHNKKKKKEFGAKGLYNLGNAGGTRPLRRFHSHLKPATDYKFEIKKVLMIFVDILMSNYISTTKSKTKGWIPRSTRSAQKVYTLSHSPNGSFTTAVYTLKCETSANKWQTSGHSWSTWV